MTGDDMGDLDELLTQREYAKERKCSERTLERERATGTGCPYVKIGRAIRYRRRDILKYIESHVRQSTSEAAQTAAVADKKPRARSDIPELLLHNPLHGAQAQRRDPASPVHSRMFAEGGAQSGTGDPRHSSSRAERTSKQGASQ